MLKRVWDSEVLMFEINLLSKPGLQFEDRPDCTISFLQEIDIITPKSINTQKEKIVVSKKLRSFPPISLYAVIFIAMVGVIFYPMISKFSINLPLKSEKISSSIIVDKVLKIIMQSKNSYNIELLHSQNENILISLTSVNTPSLKQLQKEINLDGSTAMRIFGESDNYSIIAKLISF